MRRVIVALSVFSLVAVGVVGSADAKKKKKPPQPVTREAVFAYSEPALGSADATGTCANGCVTFGVGAEESFVTIKIADDSGFAPAATIGQDLNPDDNFIDRVAEICGETEAPLAITPGAEIVVWVWAAPRFVTGGGPCPGIGTSGEVTATFSNMP
jgi:hypothetical protein